MMREFLELLPPDEARSRFLASMPGRTPKPEIVETSTAAGRVTAEDIIAPHALPSFRKSTVDGYAVRAHDSFGATAGQPSYFRIVGEVPMGAEPTQDIEVGECLLIHTGGMLPPSADAVVMLEYAQRVGASESTKLSPPSSWIGATVAGPAPELEVLRPVATGDNVIQPGEDVTKGQTVLNRGIRLRAAEIGGLMGLGITSVHVAPRPKVGLISSGDEIIEPRSEPSPGQSRDVNSYALAALVSEAGGYPVPYGIIPDEVGRLEDAAKRAWSDCDAVVISAGSSASTRDLTAAVIDRLGSPGVLVHGINIRPGKPTILGVCSGKGVIGLPGNPVSALVIARLFLVPLVEALLGLQARGPGAAVLARLNTNLASQAGREDWWPVRLERDAGTASQWAAQPIFGRSNLIFNLAAADGLLRIPPESNGLAAGELVHVELI